MGAVVDAEVDAANGGEISAVVYQLVRVEGDGRLVPATDDEVMEVEHLFDNEKGKLPSTELMGCAHREALSSKKSDLEGMSLPENAKDDSYMSDVRVEEARLWLSCESLNHYPHESLKHSPMHSNLEGRFSDCVDHSKYWNDKLQSDTGSLETTPASNGLNGDHNARLDTVETSSDLGNGEFATGSPASEICTSLQPDFSILEGEICLDEMSISGLQEAFRATFGRQTSVEDKLWLTRRIAMGLTNSLDIPSTRFIIKENKIVQKEVLESHIMVQENFFNAGALSAGQISHKNHRDSLTNLTDQIADQNLFAYEPRNPQLEYDFKDENLQIEQCAGKRVRKPTRRYIEELSDVETRDCTSRLLPSGNSFGLSQSSKSLIRPVHNTRSTSATFVTRPDSLGGYEIRVPYVSRARRGRPRKNLMVFLDFANMERDQCVGEKANHDEQYLDHGQLSSAGDNSNDHEELHSVGDNSDNYPDVMPVMKGSSGRKHHRAWSLGEVLKLVEGVARYGAGRWSEIRRVAFSSYSYRSSVDLKDKWRNLLRASFAQGSTQKVASGSRSCIPIPRPILQRVRELAEMQSQQAVIELGGGSSIVGHAGRAEVEKESGFL